MCIPPVGKRQRPISIKIKNASVLKGGKCWGPVVEQRAKLRGGISTHVGDVDGAPGSCLCSGFDPLE